ncbi:MAG: Uma2 family endonuclease [Cyanobacteria bacterium P01_G01_bin.39]
MAITTYKWSIDEYHSLIESGLLADKPVELLNGEIIEMSPEREEHSYTNDDVAQLLRDKLKGLAKIRESHPITLDNSEPEPDIAVVRLPKTIYTQHHPYPQDIYWLIEIFNKTLSKDLTEKSMIYAQNNIPEYWVVDLVNKQLIIHTDPQNNQYAQIKVYKGGTVSPLAFPDIEIALNQLLLF